jgi:hypothetical protein
MFASGAAVGTEHFAIPMLPPAYPARASNIDHRHSKRGGREPVGSPRPGRIFFLVSRSCNPWVLPSLLALGRDESQLFRCKLPVNRALGCGHRGLFDWFLARYRHARNRRRPFPHVPTQALNDAVLDAAIIHSGLRRGGVRRRKNPDPLTQTATIPRSGSPLGECSTDDNRQIAAHIDI